MLPKILAFQFIYLAYFQNLSVRLKTPFPEPRVEGSDLVHLGKL